MTVATITMASAVKPRTRLSVPYDDGVGSRSIHYKNVLRNEWALHLIPVLSVDDKYDQHDDDDAE